MVLQELLETAVHHQLITKGRLGPMRTAVKQYAQMLGVDPAHCPPELYRLSEARFTALVQAKAPAGWRARRSETSFKNNIRFLLRMGEAHQWLDALVDPIKHWRTHPAVNGEGKGAWVPRHELPPKLIYRLKPVPASLEQDMHGYLQWCQRPTQDGRPHRVKKRASSATSVYNALVRMAGFAVHYQDLPAELLTLADLCDPSLVRAYVNWWIDERTWNAEEGKGKVTPGLRTMVIYLETIARHYLKDLKAAHALKELLNGELAVVDRVRDKQTRWTSLAQIDAAGQSIYPLNPKRLKDYWEARTVKRYLADPARYHLPTKSFDLTKYAYWVGLSLLIRFLARRPLRQRNVREMRLQPPVTTASASRRPPHNLYQDSMGVWRLRFRGDQLKVARKDGRVNEYVCDFPHDLVPLLEEYLTVWRPRLATPGETHVFLNSKGNPFSANRLTGAFAVTTKRFIGVGVTPHICRDIWATEYLKQFPGDAAGVAKWLGNTIQMVYKHYAHLLDQDADRRAEHFLTGAFEVP